jgi:hypothetical protein
MFSGMNGTRNLLGRRLWYLAQDGASRGIDYDLDRSLARFSAVINQQLGRVAGAL